MNIPSTTVPIISDKTRTEEKQSVRARNDLPRSMRSGTKLAALAVAGIALFSGESASASPPSQSQTRVSIGGRLGLEINTDLASLGLSAEALSIPTGTGGFQGRGDAEFKLHLGDRLSLGVVGHFVSKGGGDLTHAYGPIVSYNFGTCSLKVPLNLAVAVAPSDGAVAFARAGVNVEPERTGLTFGAGAGFEKNGTKGGEEVCAGASLGLKVGGTATLGMEAEVCFDPKKGDAAGKEVRLTPGLSLEI